MAYQPNPNDPFRPNPSSDELNRQARTDNELQVDPELAEGPASGGRIAMYALAAALVLGAVFYGLNNTSMNPSGTGQTATGTATQNTAQSSPPPAPAGMRDVTPRNNTEPGTTVGAAPAKPMTPPKAGPTGTEVDRSGSPTPEPTTK
jgi:hypothetical protein